MWNGSSSHGWTKFNFVLSSDPEIEGNKDDEHSESVLASTSKSFAKNISGKLEKYSLPHGWTKFNFVFPSELEKQANKDDEPSESLLASGTSKELFSDTGENQSMQMVTSMDDVSGPNAVLTAIHQLSSEFKQFKKQGHRATMALINMQGRIEFCPSGLPGRQFYHQI